MSTNTGSDEDARATINILLKQNASLEREVRRLVAELGDATQGVMKCGYLHMWRDRTISYASRWGLRYFSLKGSTLSYFHEETDLRPRKTIDMTHCVVRYEGVKKNGQYHVFGIYLADTVNLQNGPESGVMMRLSSENEGDARQWIEMLDRASRLRAGASIRDVIQVSSDSPPPSDRKVVGGKTTGSEKQSGALYAQGVDESDEIDLKHLSTPTLQRVQSAEMTLRMSKSVRSLSVGSMSDLMKEDANSMNASTPQSSSNKPILRNQSLPNLTPASQAAHQAKPPSLFPASRPMHTKSGVSPLSSEARAHEQNYRGFFHLGVIILAVSHFRMIYDNFAKHGWLFATGWSGAETYAALIDNIDPLLSSMGSWVLTLALSLAVQRLAVVGLLKSEKLILIINIVLGTCNIVIPCLWVWNYGTSPVWSMVYLMQSVIIWMKLISYAHTNRDLRLMTKAASETSGQLRSPHPSVRGGVEDDNAKPVNAFAEVADLEGPILRYPENITVSNLLYFMMVPTLCYQLNYPRSPRIRLKYVATILVRMALVAFLIIFFIEQYVSPTLTNAVQPFRDYDPLGILRLLLRLSITNTYIWLLGFYFYFHLYLNLFAELTRFGDRVFYKDWWNARTIDRYWRSWNLPVHHWMVRHVYYPLIRAGTGKTVAMFLVFLISAAFHEVVISVPFRTLTMHAFVGMLAQAPLSYLTKKLDKVFDNAMIGNSLFWIVFCIVGQPMGILLHYNDLQKHAL